MALKSIRLKTDVVRSAGRTEDEFIALNSRMNICYTRSRSKIAQKGGRKNPLGVLWKEGRWVGY